MVTSSSVQIVRVAGGRQRAVGCADETQPAIAAADIAYVCHFEPEPEGGLTATCPRLPPVVTYGETFERARENAREAIELCLEVIKADRQPIPPPDQDLMSSLDQLVPVAVSGI